MAIIIHFCFDIATIVRLYWDCNIVSIQTTINFTIALYCIDNCFDLSTVLSGAVGFFFEFVGCRFEWWRRRTAILARHSRCHHWAWHKKPSSSIYGCRWHSIAERRWVSMAISTAGPGCNWSNVWRRGGRGPEQDRVHDSPLLPEGASYAAAWSASVWHVEAP